MSAVEIYEGGIEPDLMEDEKGNANPPESIRVILPNEQPAASEIILGDSHHCQTVEGCIQISPALLLYVFACYIGRYSPLAIGRDIANSTFEKSWVVGATGVLVHVDVSPGLQFSPTSRQTTLFIHVSNDCGCERSAKRRASMLVWR
ncbi:hypothetical protein VE02_08759 [Pseudogymnoascus sp. 03VT05]|nr:hypothetical protein VE02_08759 [Pseudogymnoascus sp. 03VT05]